MTDDTDTLPTLDAATAAAHLAYLKHLELQDRVLTELEDIANAKAARAAAKAAGLRLYAGKPCHRDHGTDRRVSDNKCPTCAKESTKASMRKKRGTRTTTRLYTGPKGTPRQRLAAMLAAKLEADKDGPVKT